MVEPMAIISAFHSFFFNYKIINEEFKLLSKYTNVQHLPTITSITQDMLVPKLPICPLSHARMVNLIKTLQSS